jgi:exopolysaccharide biosynthesis polyprenyl glycosylphosphotransferase
MFADELIFSSAPPEELLPNLLEEARAHEINLRYIPTVSQALRNTHKVEYIGDLPTIVLFETKNRPWPLLVKRGIDIVLSLIAMVLLSPVFAAVALAIKLQSAGPVFYPSERVGRKGRLFTCYKFRTMIPNAEALRSTLLHLNERSGVLFKMTNDPRVTRIGRILRKYSLDELPQLWNVLRGDMSLVGPRPCIQSELAQYETSHYRRLDVVPGLTGLWQVKARHDPSFETYIQLDTQYVREWSIWLDLSIMLRTLRVVLFGTGV